MTTKIISIHNDENSNDNNSFAYLSVFVPSLHKLNTAHTVRIAETKKQQHQKTQIRVHKSGLTDQGINQFSASVSSKRPHNSVRVFRHKQKRPTEFRLFHMAQQHVQNEQSVRFLYPSQIQESYY
jgi:hypothetical protein